MKRALCICVFVLGLAMAGCSQTNKYTDRFIEISTEKLIEKINDRDSFIVSFTQPSCGYCISFKKMLVGYLNDNDVILFEVSLDRKDINLDEIKTYFPNQSYTPDVYYIKDGEIYDRLDANAIDISSEKNFNDWVDKNQLNSDKSYLK